MPSDIVTTQGLAWDNISRVKLGSEKLMGKLLPENIEDMDSLLFPGGTAVRVPDIELPASRSLPPWERM